MIHGLDTGFLVAAEVTEHAEHTGARDTLARLLSAGDLIAIAPQVLAEFIHIVTDPRRFAQPLDMTAARQLAEQRCARWKQIGRRAPGQLTQAWSRRAGARGSCLAVASSNWSRGGIRVGSRKRAIEYSEPGLMPSVPSATVSGRKGYWRRASPVESQSF